MSLIHTSPVDWTVPSWLRDRPFAWPSWLDDVATTTHIRVEEYEEGDDYVIRAEAPGINPDTDIDLTIDGFVLRLDVRRHQKKESDKRKHRHSEFFYGSFTRVITLPRRAAVKDVDAQYEDGILEVRVPLNGKDADTRHVPIRHK